MSATFFIVGRKRLMHHEIPLINAYNAFIHNGLDIPDDLKKKLIVILGKEPEDGWDEPIKVHGGSVFEYEIDMDGSPYYGDGATVDLGKLPDGTTELRIYVA